MKTLCLYVHASGDFLNKAKDDAIGLANDGFGHWQVQGRQCCHGALLSDTPLNCKEMLAWKGNLCT